jgi:hypothetical protein
VAAEATRHGGPVFRVSSVCHSLPFQPITNPGTSNGNRFISRPLKLSAARVSAFRVRNHVGPLIAAGACKNDKLNTFVFHANETLPRYNQN